MVKSITCYVMLNEGGQLTLNKITEEKKWVYGFQILRNLKSNVTQQYVSRATSALKLLKLSFQHLDNKIFDALRLRLYVCVYTSNIASKLGLHTMSKTSST